MPQNLPWKTLLKLLIWENWGDPSQDHKEVLWSLASPLMSTHYQAVLEWDPWAKVTGALLSQARWPNAVGRASAKAAQRAWWQRHC